MDIVESLRTQLQEARNNIIALKKELQGKEMLVRDLENTEVKTMKGSMDKMIREGNTEGIRQVVGEAERKLAVVMRVKEEGEAKIGELQERIQKQA